MADDFVLMRTNTESRWLGLSESEHNMRILCFSVSQSMCPLAIVQQSNLMMRALTPVVYSCSMHHLMVPSAIFLGKHH